jgi:ubiquinone/menaquinone biosynthesis C-methylase UbiE
MSKTNESGQYNGAFNTALQWMWGDGFLSPGGPEEVATMLQDVDISGRKVLDIGSGLGAIDVLLVAQYGAASVLGVDVEAHLIDEARERASRAGVSEQVSFQLIEPGPLPFADNSYDVIFTKDAIVHIPDKAAFYLEVRRVLKPEGLFIGSDWLRGDAQTITARAEAWLEYVHLNFQMQDIAHTDQAMQDGGFNQPRFNDRNEWYKTAIKHELASVSGARLTDLAAKIGQEQAQYRQKSSELKQQAIEDGFLRPTHFVAQKPPN